jgi:hypothetical protein
MKEKTNPIEAGMSTRKRCHHTMKRIALAVLILLTITTTSWSQVTFPFEIVNNSPFADSELYVAVVGIDYTTNAHVWIDPKTSRVFPMDRSYNTVPGPTPLGDLGPGGDGKYANCFAKLSEIPGRTFNLPPIAGCRVFISKGSQLYFYFFGSTGAPAGYTAPNHLNPTDPNTGIMFEIIELTNNQYGFFGNTSRVDAFKYPMGLELYGTNGYYKKVGDLKTHEEVLQLFQENMPEEFQGCINAYGEIWAPSKTPEFQDGTGGTTVGPYADYLKPYIDQIWEKYKTTDMVFFSGDAGTFRCRVMGEELQCREINGGFGGKMGKVVRRPTTQEALEGKGVLDYGPNADTRTVDLVVQSQLTAAINRHVVDVTTPVPGTQNWHDKSAFYKADPMNHYARFWHLPGICIDQLAYGFAYDDVADHSPSLHTPVPTKAIATFGGYAGLDTCEVASINPYLSVNGGALQNVSSPTVTAGQSIRFAPQPSDGFWQWTGPSGFSAATREVTIQNITSPKAGTYTARYTNACGASATREFVVTLSNNIVPVITLTSPSSGATFNAPANIVINATASDSDGSVANVRFFVNGNLVAEDTMPPYTQTFRAESAGELTIAAEAIDDDGASTTSGSVVVNVGEVVTCSGSGPVAAGQNSPDYSWEADGVVDPTITFIPGAPITGSTMSLLYYKMGSGGYMGVFMSPSAGGFTKSINAPAGATVTFYFTYRVGNTGVERNSSATPHSFTVGDCGRSNENQLPAISITSPANNASYTTPAVVTINANASDVDGTISKVQFFDGSTLLGEDTTVPYSYSWSGGSTGTHALTVKATDNEGGSSVSSPVTVTITEGTGGNTCTGTVDTGDYRYEVVTSDGKVNWKFVPLSPIAGCTMAIIYVKAGAGGYAGYTMNASGSNFVFEQPHSSGTPLSFYFTYRVGNTGVERNSSASPHSYVAGDVCTSSASSEARSFSQEAVTVYPNPVRNILRINSSIPDGEKVLVVDYSGRERVKVVKDNSINVSDFSPGLYTILGKIKGRSFRQRFVKE